MTDKNHDIKTCHCCGAKTHITFVIDVWAIIDGKFYCFECQKKHKVGWFEKPAKYNHRTV